jgi:FkbM family methyltransferase
VWAFEAHPELFEELRANVARWPGAIRAVNAAIWRAHGTVVLEMPPGFATNRGLARVSTGGAAGIEVPARTLDECFAEHPAPSLVKLDVEGHEMAVLEGGARTLERLRDCIFEEHAEPPTPVTERFRAAGFEVYRMARSLRHVRLLPLDSGEPRSAWEPTNFLATRDARRALARLRAPGWQSLRGAPSRA